MHSCTLFSRAIVRASLVAALLIFTLVSCQKDRESPTAPESDPALAITTTALSFRQVSAGAFHSCGVTTDDKVYCWGSNSFGRLGDGTTAQRSTLVLVVGGYQFRQVSAGYWSTCGVTTDNRAYCWGDNTYGELGDGTTTRRLKPIPVAGGLQFREVDVDVGYACGVSFTDRRAYCWGRNTQGQLGDGTTTQRLTPVRVAGSRQFRQVSPGNNHTCGVTTDSRAFCWGWNFYGQIGDSTRVEQRLKPSMVIGGHLFRQVTAGHYHTCAVTTDDQAYCWGWNALNQMGVGQAYKRRFWPEPVAGGLNFRRVSAGEYHTCGVTTLNRAYCWGDDTNGQLGAGGEWGIGATPVAVLGGHLFRQVAAGSHTCAVTTRDRAYCWGYNASGQLGDGTHDSQSMPVPVLGPM